MIRVTIELLPKGDEARAKVLGTMIIVNDATGTESIGNYDCFFVRKGYSFRAYRDKWFRVTRVEGYRKKATNIWMLVKKALEGVYGKD